MKNYRVISELLKQEIRKYLMMNNSYKNIKKMLENKVSLFTIYKINKNFKGVCSEEKFKMKIRHNIEQKKTKKIYLEIDDSYVKSRLKNNRKIKFRGRMLVLHLGKYKGKIMSKIMLMELKSLDEPKLSNQEWKVLIEKKIAENYRIDDYELIVFGDGARWIKGLAKLLRAKYILDEFHIKMLAFKTFDYGKYKTINKKIFKKYRYYNDQTLYKYIMHSIKGGDYIVALNELKWICSTIDNKMKIEDIIGFIKYIKNNKNGIDHYRTGEYFTSRTEAFISHYFKKNIVKKFALFGKEVMENILRRQQNSNFRVFLI